jgi:phosphatidate cytidylyltransferase
MSKRSNLAVRVATAAVASPVLIYLLLWAPKWAFIALVALACLVAAAELFQLTLPGRRSLQTWGAIASLACLGAMLRYQQQPTVIGLSVVTVVLAGMVAGLVQPEPIADAARRMAWLIAGPFYLGSLLGVIGLLFLREQGGYWVVFALLVTWLGDTAAYFVGKTFGRHKLYPAVSPKKTVEGAVAGVVGSMAGALIAHFWFLPVLPLISGLVVAAIGGAIGQLGDLCESLIKRSVGAKDSGWIVPGHGGLLDRIDAVLFVGPVVWLYAQWIQP